MEHTYIISGISIILSLVVVTVFIAIHYQRVLEKNAYIDELEQKLHTLEKSISETIDLITLEPLLKKELMGIFGAKTALLAMYHEWEDIWYFSAIREYFRISGWEGVFENSEDSIDAIGEESLKEKLKRSLPSDIAYIFPIYSTQGFHIGNLVLWEKFSWASYMKDEIEFLKEFSFFVEIHLKYIRTYTLMHEFSNLLDEKVDNKTIAYNNLLNRQKEFIKVISHEVRSPLTSAIFQVETSIESLEGKNFQRENTLQELKELKHQLVRTGWLISKLFSVEYYDNESVSLFREAIHLPKFLEYEIELFSRVNQDVAFLSRIDHQIGFVPIDKVQFQQVLTNLIDNAIKFTSKEQPKVFISAKRVDTEIHMTVEDNGKGFSQSTMKSIFEKYSTGSNKNIWLWLGLYLCRKIITLHNGTIEASNSLQYGWACFTLKIPITTND